MVAEYNRQMAFRFRLLLVGGALAAVAGCSMLPVSAPQPSASGAQGDPSTAAAALPGDASGAAAALAPGTSPAPQPSPTSHRSQPPDPADSLPTAQADPEAKGPAEFVHRVVTTDKVAFLTLDDGVVTDPGLIAFLTEHKIPVTTFFTTMYGDGHWDYWRQISRLGSIQNHTVSHPTLTKLGESGAAEEICSANTAISAEIGKTPWMLRPPYGVYGDSTLAAAGDCGLDYVVHWSVTLPDEEFHFQEGDRFQPGDIILSHYRDDLIPHLKILLAELQRQGFRLARLEEYLPPKP
jgi:peptidoglycan/xylan/chitin deacetylase (PgdA/CDA1 family)